MTGRLNGKVAIVTGGGQGVERAGRAVAHRMPPWVKVHLAGPGEQLPSHPAAGRARPA